LPPPPRSTLLPYTTLFRSPVLAALNILLIILALLAWVSLLVAVVYLVMGIVGWRGPHRNRRFIRAVLFALLFPCVFVLQQAVIQDRKSTRLNSSHLGISYA